MQVVTPASMPRAPRVRFVHPVWIQPLTPSGKSERLQSSNLSVGGMFIQSNTPPAPGSQWELLLESRGKAFRLARAEVVWQRSEPNRPATGFGVRFVDVRPRAQELLQYLVGKALSAKLTPPQPQRHNTTLEFGADTAPDGLELPSVRGKSAPPTVSLAEAPPRNTPPVEVVHFHPPPKVPPALPEESETPMSGLFRMNEEPTNPAAPNPFVEPAAGAAGTEAAAMNFGVPLPAAAPAENEPGLGEEPITDTFLRPIPRWPVFVGFTLLGALGVWVFFQQASPSGVASESPPPQLSEPAPAPTAEAPMAAPAAPVQPVAPKVKALAVVEPPEPPSAHQAVVPMSGAVVRVEARLVQDTFEVELALTPDGAIDRWFILQSPPRLVVDVLGEAPTHSERRELPGGVVVRAGKKEMGMRVVFDLPRNPLTSKRQAQHFTLTLAP